MSSNQLTTLKPPNFDLSEDEAARRRFSAAYDPARDTIREVPDAVPEDTVPDGGYQSIMGQAKTGPALSTTDTKSRRSSKQSEKHSAFTVMNKACSFLRDPPATFSLKPLATMTKFDQQFLHILAWNVRLLDSDTVTSFDANDVYHINSPHNEQSNYLPWFWSYMLSLNPPIPRSNQLLHAEAVADAIITHLREKTRSKAEDGREKMWESINSTQSDLTKLSKRLREAETLALLEPDRPQMAF